MESRNIAVLGPKRLPLAGLTLPLDTVVSFARILPLTEELVSARESVLSTLKVSKSGSPVIV